MWTVRTSAGSVRGSKPFPHTEGLLFVRRSIYDIEWPIDYCSAFRSQPSGAERSLLLSSVVRLLGARLKAGLIPRQRPEAGFAIHG